MGSKQPNVAKSPAMKVRKGDTVVVLAGKDKGVRGKVIAAFPATQKVLVEGVAAVKKHQKMNMSRRGSQQGGILTQEAPIHVSNVMVVDSEGSATRVGYRHDEDGNKVRTSRRSQKDLES